MKLFRSLEYKSVLVPNFASEGLVVLFTCAQEFELQNVHKSKSYLSRTTGIKCTLLNYVVCSMLISSNSLAFLPYIYAKISIMFDQIT